MGVMDGVGWQFTYPSMGPRPPAFRRKIGTPKSVFCGGKSGVSLNSPFLLSFASGK